MIHLTRLNNKPLVVNSDLIKFIENAPDTVITLVSGEKIVVLESSQEIISRVIDFRRQLSSPLPDQLALRGPEATPGVAEEERDEVSRKNRQQEID